MKIRITFLDELLGTQPMDSKLHEEYIASKAPDAKSREEEVAIMGIDGVVEKGKTTFPCLDDGTPFVWDYQIKGYFKDACGMLRMVSGTKASKIKAYKKTIDGLIFVTPRKIPIKLNGEMGNCQRPLRASTPQGERVALSNSDTVPEGSSIELEIVLLDESHRTLIEELLNYGELRGLGQWRNSGKGRFRWEEIA